MRMALPEINGKHCGADGEKSKEGPPKFHRRAGDDDSSGPGWVRWRQRIHEADIRSRKAANVREDGREIVLRKTAIPFCERRGIFVDRGARQPPSFADVIRSAEHDVRVCAVNVASFDRAAEHQGVTAPGVIGAAAVRLKGPAEIRGSEKGDPIGNSQFFCRLVESVYRLAQLG